MNEDTTTGPPIRPELRGRSAYGAPQLDVPVLLNTNENSYPVPEQAVEAITAALADQVAGLNRYPDREFSALRVDLADYLNDRHGTELDAAQIWAGNGSNEVLQHIFQTFGGPGRTALGFTPAYSMHPLISQGTHTAWIDGFRGTGEGHEFDLSAELVADQIRQHRPNLVFLVSPNNPTGTALELDVVRAALQAVAGEEAMVVVDEAYAEFARSGTPSAVSLLNGPLGDRLIVTRTLSKAFALAGARVGYLAADAAVCTAFRLVRLPYHLSSLTQAAARAALSQADLLLGTVEAIKEQRDRIVAELHAMGLRPVPSDANFVLFGPLDDADVTWRGLLDRGVLIRDVGIAHHLRVTAGTEAETSAFLKALAETLGAAAPGSVAHDRTIPSPAEPDPTEPNPAQPEPASESTAQISGATR